MTAASGLVALAVLLAACSSTASNSANENTGSHSTIPSSAFGDHTGVTPSTITVGNISTQVGGLFTGAAVGTEAYAEYVNSAGGVDGRKIVVDATNDQFQGADNKNQTQAAIQKDFALVGGFSLEDTYGASAIAANPTVSNVAVSLSQVASDLPNTFSVSPVRFGWGLGGLSYFKQKYPAAIKATGAIVANQPSSERTWKAEKQAMESIGYKILDDPTYPVTQTDFTQDVVAMKNVGVQILFLEQMPENYAAAVIKALHQQNYHPVVVLGAAAYSEAFVPTAGGAANTEGIWLNQNTALYLGEDAFVLSADRTFLHWVQVASPGFKPDLFTLFGWLSGELFVQALRASGSDPSRGSLLEQLRKITTFTGGGLIAKVDPAKKVPSGCYLIAKIVNGTFQRYQDPPTTGPTQGFRCDKPFYYAK